jgi:S-phase kinase-associated protein 1
MIVTTSDGHTATVPDSLVAACTTLKLSPEGGTGGAVPLPNVTTSALKRIVEYHALVERLQLVNTSGYDLRGLKDEFFARLDLPDLFDAMEAMNFMGADQVLDDACAYVAALIRGRTPAHIRAVFGLELDSTAEQAAEMASSLSWAVR